MDCSVVLRDGTVAHSGGRAPAARSDPSPQPAAAVLRLQRAAGNRATARLVQRTPTPPNRTLPAPPRLAPGVELVPLAKIEYTQPAVSFTTRDKVTLGKMARDMRITGWDYARPADVVRMPDGRIVSLDHRRLWAADRAGTIDQISARVHAPDERLSPDTAKRLAIKANQVPTGINPVTKQPWKVGDKPVTWGHAIEFRSLVQPEVAKPMQIPGAKATQLPGTGGPPGDPNTKAGTRDPGFPAQGSKDKPMRVQPGPFKHEDPPPAKGGAKPGGGGGGEKPASGSSSARPAESAGTAAPPQKAGQSGSRTSADPAGRAQVEIRLGSVLRLGGHVLIQLALGWASAKLESSLVASKFANNVDPHVSDAMSKLAPIAEKLTAENPIQPVYLQVTVDTKWMTAAGPGVSQMNFVDVVFVGPVSVSREKVENDRIVSNTSGGPNPYGITTAYPVYRVTYSIPVQFDETAAQHAERVENFEVADQAESGRSVRKRAESGLASASLEDQFGEGLKPSRNPTNRARTEAKAWAIRWTKKYIEYTKSRLHLAALHADAVQYLNELEGRAQPARWDQRFIDPSERKELEKFMHQE